MIAGTLPGMLLRVIRTCERDVVFKERLFVGLGAIMMGGHLLFGGGMRVQSPFVQPVRQSPFVPLGQ